jgi:tetratricopeptide (TPR) repeat protein
MKLRLHLYIFILGSILPLRNIYCQESLSSDDVKRLEYAKDLYAAGKYTQTIDYCSDILNRRHNADVFELRAKCYRSNGDYASAVKDYTEALQGDRNASVYEDLGMCNFCIENYDEAVKNLTEAIRLSLLQDPNMATYNFLLYEARGRTYLQLGQYGDAINDLAIAAENGSGTAAIEILSPMLHNNMMDDIKDFTTRLLKPQSNGATAISDSSMKNYITALYSVSANHDATSACNYIDNAINQYQGFQKSCYKSLTGDMYYAKAALNQMAGNDSLAYAFYTKAYNADNNQTDIKSKIDILKIKLGIDVTPPSITLVNPVPDPLKKNTIEVTTASVDLYGKVQDSSGVASLMVNDKSISKIEEDGTFIVSLDLEPGINNITINATDKFENKATKTIKINLVAQTDSSQLEDVAAIPQLFTYANYYAVLIGEKDYTDPGFQDLQSPASDALDLKKILSSYYQFDPNHITTLINSSRTNILDSLTTIASGLKQDDNLLVFYAGHGAVKRLGSQVVSGYVVPSDAKKDSYATYIKSDDLKEAVETSEAKHILFIVDACFAGTLFRGTMDEAPKSIQNLYKQTSRQMISSGNVEEVPDNGQFIKNLKDYLTENKNSFFSSLDLFNYLVKNDDATTPQRGVIKDLGDTGGDFIFAKK